MIQEHKIFDTTENKDIQFDFIDDLVGDELIDEAEESVAISAIVEDDPDETPVPDILGDFSLSEDKKSVLGFCKDLEDDTIYLITCVVTTDATVPHVYERTIRLIGRNE